MGFHVSLSIFHSMGVWQRPGRPGRRRAQEAVICNLCDAGSSKLVEDALAVDCGVGWGIQAELSYFVFILESDLTLDFIL